MNEINPDRYDVFTRSPWKRNSEWPGGWEPNGAARKRYVARGVTIEDARALCEERNAKNARGKPGQLWTEFERNY